MRTAKLRAVPLAAFISIAASLLPATAPIAHACSIGSFGTPERQLEMLLEAWEGSELVFVGTVMRERHVGKIEENEVYVSEVKPEAYLVGDLETDTIAVRAVAFDDKFCAGGPRLREGEKMLLAVDWTQIDSGLKGEESYAWALHHFLGKVLIDDSIAMSQYADRGFPIGTPGEVTGVVGRALDASRAQIDAAVAASAAEPLPIPSRTAYTLRFAAIAGIVIAVVAIAIAKLRSHRKLPAAGTTD